MAALVEMQQPQPRPAQHGSLKVPSNSAQQQQPASQRDTGQKQLGATPRASGGSVWRVLLWICRGWWNSALWWLIFSCGWLVWCVAYARADDGGAFEGTLQFCLYFIRVGLRTFLISTSISHLVQVLAGFAAMRLMIGLCWKLSWLLVLSKFPIFREVFG